MYQARKGVLKRTVTQQECPWLEKDFQEGEEIYYFPGCTYGCISSEGDAFTLSPTGDNPFFELPENAVTPKH